MTTTTSTTTAATRAATAPLASYDLAMQATAVNYDVLDRADCQRSVTDLVQLFFGLARALRVDLFVEAGAKEAAASRRARRRLDPSRIVAFEANPYTFRHYDRPRNRAAGVEYVHSALSDHVGEVTFNVLTTPDGAPRVDGRSSLLVRETDPGSVAVTVPATTLDAFFADHAYERSAMWVDVEGALDQVLGGADETLRRAAVVLVEVEDRRYWRGQWLRDDVLAWCHERGLVPVARDYQTRYQYNVVLVRADLVDQPRVRWLLTWHRSQGGRRAPVDVTRGSQLHRSAAAALRRLPVPVRARLRRLRAR